MTLSPPSPNPHLFFEPLSYFTYSYYKAFCKSTNFRGPGINVYYQCYFFSSLYIILVYRFSSLKNYIGKTIGNFCSIYKQINISYIKTDKFLRLKKPFYFIHNKNPPELEHFHGRIIAPNASILTLCYRWMTLIHRPG